MATKEDMIMRALADYEKYRENSGDYQSRFCYELVEIRDRIDRLERFLERIPLPDGLIEDHHRRNLLHMQLSIMRSYQLVLEMRYKNDLL
jgi:hypothetical protein